MQYGGAYSNREDDAVKIRDFLKRYIEVEKQLSGIKHLCCLDSLGKWEYSIETLGGKVFKYGGQICAKYDFKQVFAELLKNGGCDGQ